MSNEHEAVVSAVPDASARAPEEAAETLTSRRGLFAAAAAAGLAVLSRPAPAQAQRFVRPHISRPQAPPASGDSLLRLVRRATNGVTEEEMALAKKLGFRGYLTHQLRYTEINDSETEAFVNARFPNL